MDGTAITGLVVFVGSILIAFMLLYLWNKEDPRPKG